MEHVALLLVVCATSAHPANIRPPLPTGQFDLPVRLIPKVSGEVAAMYLTDRLAILPAQVDAKAPRLEGTERRDVLVLLLQVQQLLARFALLPGVARGDMLPHLVALGFDRGFAVLAPRGQQVRLQLFVHGRLQPAAAVRLGFLPDLNLHVDLVQRDRHGDLVLERLALDLEQLSLPLQRCLEVLLGERLGRLLARLQRTPPVQQQDRGGGLPPL